MIRRWRQLIGRIFWGALRFVSRKAGHAQSQDWSKVWPTTYVVRHPTGLVIGMVEFPSEFDRQFLDEQGVLWGDQ